ncbi:solute carrier family 25 member 38 [Trichodelitschia bisporula]|uniref:Mitochondrial glycine transporter n=1 Tax=Trichodelitschia bisporula TaxID=703511 RepID=A0A6G1HYV5_9PEZI|nr:solute carrier family 25 member 38 [Trichodelitschia bisporula]
MSTKDAVTSGSKPKQKQKTTFHLLAGLASGLLSATLLQPADLLKTRLQQSTTTSPHPLLHTLRQILSSPQPLRTLWRGTAPSALRTGAGSALYFGGLNALRESLAARGFHSHTRATSSSLPALSPAANLAAGAVARAAAGFVLMPVTVIKVRLESSLYAYAGMRAALADIWRAEGVRGLFAGAGATAVRDAPYAGLYVLFYESGKRRLGALVGLGSGDAGYGAGVNFASGVGAAALATAVTNPFDAIKTRLQLMPRRYGNLVKCAGIMMREEGVGSLFSGLGLRIGRKAMSSALAWTVYEELIRRGERRWVGVL